MEGSCLKDSHFSLNISSHIRDICNPLFSLLNISYVYSTRLFPDKSEFVLCTHPEVVSYGYAEKFKIPKSSDVEQQVLSCGWFLPEDTFFIPELKSQYYELVKRFNIRNCLLGVKQYSSYVDLFILGCDGKNTPMQSLFLNNIDLIEKFWNYFQVKTRKIYKKADDEANRLVFPGFSFTENGGDAFSTIGCKSNLMAELSNAMGNIVQNSKGVALTNREYQLLSQLSLGKSLKEIAYSMGLSPRTVSVYYSNIKAKFEYCPRSEIISLFRSQLILSAND